MVSKEAKELDEFVKFGIGYWRFLRYFRRKNENCKHTIL